MNECNVCNCTTSLKNSGRIIEDHMYTYERICEIRDFLNQKTGNFSPRIGIICGSGLGSLGETVKDPVVIDYNDIPFFPLPTAVGHEGKLIFGYVSDIPVVCMQGRFHYYEGHSMATCVMPVRLMKLLSVKYLVASNAAGSVNTEYNVGDVMLQKDHFNFMGLAGIGCLIGPHDDRWGDRFVSMTNCYDPELLSLAKSIAAQIGIQDSLHEGVYSCVGGPNFETVAELRGLRVLGIDAAGMSTVHEITAARQCGIRCFAFSLITNVGVSDYDQNVNGPTSDEVLTVGEMKKNVLKLFVERLIEAIGEL